jgi:DNA-binding IclR family transcriptional regulator
MSISQGAHKPEPSPGPDYHVPALEKGLDILECLAAQGVPLTQAQVARALGRRPTELFRMLTALERRGYIQRDPLSGAYRLTMRLYELGHAHSPYDGLLRAAERPMRALTEEVRESCHLSVIHRGQLFLLAEEQSPTRVRLSVEVGSSFPLLNAASGRLLLAYLDAYRREETLVQDTDFLQFSADEQR